MNFRKHAHMPLVALVLALPMLAQANSLYHPSTGEASFTEHPDHWAVRQIFDDPAGDHDWGISATVDLAESAEAGIAVVRVTAVGMTDA